MHLIGVFIFVAIFVAEVVTANVSRNARWHQEHAEKINALLKHKHPVGTYAVLALEDTMATGDIGEVVLAWASEKGKFGRDWQDQPAPVRIRGHQKPFEVYNTICNEVSFAACRQWMAGLFGDQSVREIEDWVEDVLRSPQKRTVRAQADRRVTVEPVVAYPTIIDLVKVLKEAGITVFVMTSAPVFVARPFVREVFEIEPQYVLGVSNLLKVKDDIVHDGDLMAETRNETQRLQQQQAMTSLKIDHPGASSQNLGHIELLAQVDLPIPVDTGVAALIDKTFGPLNRPILTLGSDMQHLPMMRTTQKDGLRIWLDRPERLKDGYTRTQELVSHLRDYIDAGIEKEDRWILQYVNPEDHKMEQSNPDPLLPKLTKQ